jgi:hypothetical protein
VDAPERLRINRELKIIVTAYPREELQGGMVNF